MKRSCNFKQTNLFDCRNNALQNVLCVFEWSVLYLYFHFAFYWKRLCSAVFFFHNVSWDSNADYRFEAAVYQIWHHFNQYYSDELSVQLKTEPLNMKRFVDYETKFVVRGKEARVDVGDCKPLENKWHPQEEERYVTTWCYRHRYFSGMRERERQTVPQWISTMIATGKIPVLNMACSV